MHRQIEVVFSPALFKYRKLKDNTIIVIVDILRATTSICSAFNWGVEAIIPVLTLEEAKEYKNKGYIVAGERIERNFDFADFGNGAFEFMNDKIIGKEIVHSTTNGTVAITMAKDAGANEILIGAFSNLSVLADYLSKKDENILILCSGWKNNFCLEDSVFAGALIERLLNNSRFIIHNDSSHCSLELWKLAQSNLLEFMDKASHIHRLRNHHLDDVFEYTFTLDTCPVVPRLIGDKLKNALLL